MKRFFTWMLFAAFSFTLPLYAQNSGGTVRSKVIKNIDGTEYYIHTIQKGQTLYGIAKVYDVEMAEIIDLNPEIREGLKPGLTLRIPAPKQEKLAEKPKKGKQPVEEPAVPAPPPPPAVQENVPCGKDNSTKKEVYDVAIMMHFRLNEIDSIRFDDPDADPDSFHSLQFIQFYEGFLMGVDSLKKTGLNVRLHVYDIAVDTLGTKRFLQDESLKKMDMIFALVYYRNFVQIADFARTNHIPIISPVSERESQVNGNPVVIKVRPSLESLYPNAAAMIARDFRTSNIIIVRNSLARVKEACEMLNTLLSGQGITSVVVDNAAMADNLKKDVKNLVVLITENKTYSLDMLTHLNGLKDQYDITVLGLPQWDRLEGMEYDFLSNLKTHILAPYFIDYSDPAVQRFIRLYQEQYKTDPELLAFVGEDVAYYFLTALMKYGTGFMKCLPELRMNLMQASFGFSATEGNGYENQEWVVFYYENYRLYKEEY
jgi:LysM repeat protein